MIKIRVSGTFKGIEKLLNEAKKKKYLPVLEKYANLGKTALSNATPKDTGLTSLSWDYKILFTRKGYSIIFTNSNEKNGVSIALLLQYGHGTPTGTYVQGTDYINPALKPIMDGLSNALFEEVSNL